VVAAILDRAKQEGRELSREERYDVKVLGNVRFQDLRHTFITWMAERGVPLQIVQSMVGHMSVRMTRHYTHVSSQAARQAVELLDGERFVGDFVGKVTPAHSCIRRLLN
jgi:integrase